MALSLKLIQQTRKNAVSHGAQHRLERYLDTNGFHEVKGEGCWVGQSSQVPGMLRVFVDGPNWILYAAADSVDEPTYSGAGIKELQGVLCE